MQALTWSFGHFCKLLETERRIHQVSKNNARRFRPAARTRQKIRIAKYLA